MNYVERHFGDWARDTAHLSMLEDGAYNRLCDLYYVREAPLPPDLSSCCRLVRATTTAERAAVKSVLAEFFELTQEGWRHKRCDIEIERFRTKSGKASASAKARWGAQPTQSECNANADANASPDAMRTHSERSNLALPHAGAGGRAPTPQTPNTKHQGIPPRAKRTAPPRVPIPPEFGVSDRVQRWAGENGYGQLEQHLDAFKRKASANAYRYADWDSAFMEAVREDWAKLRGRTANGAPPAGENATTASSDAADDWLEQDRQHREQVAAERAARLAARAAA